MQDINTHNAQIGITPLSESASDKMPAEFYSHMSQILKQARGRAYSAVNYSMVLAYWEIG